MTPTEILAARIENLTAEKALLDERLYWATAEIARLNARLGDTEYRTAPPPNWRAPKAR